jgi:hypothetical protein
MNAARLFQMGEIVVQATVSCYWQRRVPSPHTHRRAPPRQANAQRIIKLNDPHMTGWSRFLRIDQTVHAFGAMKIPPVALAMPVSMDYLPVAGDIEDVATDASRVVERVQQRINNSFTLLGIHLIHAGQAESNGVGYLKLPLNAF